MYKNSKIAVVIPAYNEEKLITKTIDTVPDFVDYIITINDGSKDKTLKIITDLAKKNKKLTVLNSEVNLGLGATMVHGYKRALETDADLFVIMAGDAQCDPDYLVKMTDELLSSNADYVKANRFIDMEALRKMPTFRRIGNIFITMLTKFATGYYSIFDTQNSYGIMRRKVLERMPMELIGKRYDFENTQLIAMSIISTRIKDYPVPAIYGEEKSSIKLLPTIIYVLKADFIGFWRRFYYKYVLYNFHPIALFLVSGLVLTTFGSIYGLYIVFRRIFDNLSPSTGTVMLVVVPFFLGFQLLLTALVMDVNNEEKP